MICKVLKFSADWCVPCRNYKSIFTEVSNLFPNIIFQEVDVETVETADLTSKYNIKSVPTTVFINCNSQEDIVKIGVLPKSLLVEILNQE